MFINISGMYNYFFLVGGGGVGRGGEVWTNHCIFHLCVRLLIVVDHNVVRARTLCHNAFLFTTPTPGLPIWITNKFSDSR